METPSITDAVDALADHIAELGDIQFSELAEYLETLGINTDGEDAFLTGEHINQPHVRTGTLLGPVSEQYVKIVEELFHTRPVMLQIGDPADFRSHQEPWWVAWVG